MMARLVHFNHLLGCAIQLLWVFVLPVTGWAFELPPQEPFQSSLSLQGYTGILNTPSAYVTQEGFFDGLYSNQRESMWRNKTSHQDNYLFSVGAFSVAEVGGRFTEAPEAVVRDLSANIKLSTEPFFRKSPFVPVFAAGYQDVGGALSQLRNRYVVASEDIWRLRVSAGYGFGPQRMKGVFVGGEFKAHDWIYLLGEYDTKETNLGIRIVTPRIWRSPISLSATAKMSLDNKPGNVEMGVGLTFPLDFQVRSVSPPLPQESVIVEPNPVVTPVPRTDPPSIPVTSGRTLESRLAALRDRLVKAGFMSIRVGRMESDTLVVEYENVIFNHNELDALGVVSGMSAEAFRDDFRYITVIIKKKSIRMVRISMPLHELAAYVAGGSVRAELAERVTVSRKCDDDVSMSFAEEAVNDSAFTASLVLWPGLTTLVGTEYGSFDYVLSLKPELFVNVWKGGLINARWDIPLSWSDNLDDGKPYRTVRTPARLERLMLFQAVKPLPDIMANLGAGMVSPDVYGTLNELAWTPGDGSHAVRFVQSWGRNDTNSKTSEIYLASYRYYLSSLDLFLTGTTGKFAAQDRGFSFEMKRMFGDTGFSAYYKNSTAEDTRHWQAVGVTFSFPLTPARDMKHYYGMQLRGTDEWQYSQETVVSNSRNRIPGFPLAATPLPTASLYDQYQNRDRLNESYIRSHLFRLRDAWIAYREKL